MLCDRLDYGKALTDISRNKYPAARVGWAYASWLAAMKWTRQRLNEGRSPSEISRLDWKVFDRNNRSKEKIKRVIQPQENQLTLF